jgi:hypothetical protein
MTSKRSPFSASPFSTVSSRPARSRARTPWRACGFSRRWRRRTTTSFGAHHYLIHGWEGSTTPERAWHASKRYPELVPNIPHALHMPGHIYAQSDRIDDAIAAFSAAADNERSYMKADTLYPNGHHGHNVHFLIHALNLDGRYQDSMKQVAHLMNDFKETPRESVAATLSAWPGVRVTTPS